MSHSRPRRSPFDAAQAEQPLRAELADLDHVPCQAARIDAASRRELLAHPATAGSCPDAEFRRRGLSKSKWRVYCQRERARSDRHEVRRSDGAAPVSSRGLLRRFAPHRWSMLSRKSGRNAMNDVGTLQTHANGGDLGRPGSRYDHRRCRRLQVHPLWCTDLGRQPLHAAAQAGALGRRARHRGLYRPRAAARTARADTTGTGGFLRPARHLAGKRGLPDPQCLVAGARCVEAAGHGVVPWRRVRLRHRECRPPAGLAAGQARRRGRRHRQPAAQHLRLPGPLGRRRRGLRRFRQCRHAGHDRRAGMGARQYRSLRRRSWQRHDLRRVRRRRQGLHVARDAFGTRPVPSRHRAKRRRGQAA